MEFRRHRKGDLLNLIVQSLYDDGWTVIYRHDPDYHPFILTIIKQGLKFHLRIYIWNLTHGGGSARAADEYRIQITGVDQFKPQEDGKVLILGWWQEGGVFAGFDFNYHSEPLGNSPSIQIKEEALRNAYVNGFAVWEKDNNEIAIAIRPDFLGEYIRNLNGLHSFGESTNDLKSLEVAVAAPDQVNNIALEAVTVERRQVVAQVARKLRDVGFKNRILNAYSNRCAFCGLQLKLVDAAHILPVENNGSDATWNGIALCALHHRAYDRNLLTFDEQYRILKNDAIFENLALQNLVEGKDQFLNIIRPMIILPPAVGDRPHTDSVKQANIIRGWVIS